MRCSRKMVLGFLARVTGGPEPSVAEAHQMVSDLAVHLGVGQRVLDHRIWMVERSLRLPARR